MHRARLTVAVLTALTPTLAVFLATLIQRQDVRDLRTEVNNLWKDMQSEMISFRNQVHADLLMIHERVARVEAKQN